MKKKRCSQRELINSWHRKNEITTDPAEFRALVNWIPAPEKLLGINRVTLSRWKKGESRIPHAAAQLIRLLNGDLPKHFGNWEGWRLTADGWIFPPGWGEGIQREDIINLWFWQRRAYMANALESENIRLKRDLAFYKHEVKTKHRLGFATSLANVLQE